MIPGSQREKFSLAMSMIALGVGESEAWANPCGENLPISHVPQKLFLYPWVSRGDKRVFIRI